MNPRDTEAALRKALELDPRNACVRIELGALYEDRGQFAQAAVEFEKAIAIEPKKSGAHCQLGRIYRKQGRWSESEAALREAQKLDPESGWGHIELGSLYQGQERFPEAAAEFERAIAIDGNNGWVHCELGKIYRKQRRSPEAEAALRRALDLGPQNACARIELGALCEDQDELSLAAVEFEKAIAIEPNNSGARCQLGRIYRKQGRWAESEASLSKALELDSESGWAHIELGTLCQGQDRVAEAAAEFERAIAMDGSNGWVHCELGHIYRRQGRPPEAEAALRRALELDPHNGRARMELGALYEDQGRFLRAEAEFAKATAIDPHNVSAHLGLGRVYLCRDRWAEAEVEFQQAAALDARHDGGYIGLWAVYRGRGRAAEAEAVLAKALKINPASSVACAELIDHLDRAKAVGNVTAREGSCAGVTDRGAPGRSGPAGMVTHLLEDLAQDIPREQMRERVFCLLPWTHLHILTDGSLCPCCAWNGPPLGNARSASLSELWNSPGLKALRSEMMSGRPVAGCWRCYEDERSGSSSMRMRSNVEFDRHRDRERQTAPDGTLPGRQVPLLDIRFSNACNLRCRLCGPSQSSAWMGDARALGLPVEGGPLQKPYDDWDSFWRQLQPLLEEGVEEIRFSGGEPLLMEEHYRILDFLIARGRTDVRLTYNTNFSTLRFQGRDAIGLWSRFRKVRVYASLDGSGRRGEYLRKGLRWDAVVANREEMLRRCPDVEFLIKATLSLFNALHLPDFHREWVEEGRLDQDAFMLNTLVAPLIYRMQVLPPALKERVLESYRRHQESFLDAGGTAARDFAAAARFLQAQDFSALLPDFVAMTRRLDQLRGEDCREVFPELAPIFEAAG